MTKTLMGKILEFLFFKFCTFLLPLYEQPFLTELILELQSLFGKAELESCLNQMDTLCTSKKTSIENAHKLEIDSLIEDVNGQLSEDSSIATTKTLTCHNILGYHTGFLKPELSKRLQECPSQIDALHAYILKGYEKRRGPKPRSSTPLVRNELLRDKIFFSEVGGPTKQVTLEQFASWYDSEFIIEKHLRNQKALKKEKKQKKEEKETSGGGLFKTMAEDKDAKDDEDEQPMFNVANLSKEAETEKEEADDDEVEDDNVEEQGKTKKRASTSKTASKAKKSKK